MLKEHAETRFHETYCMQMDESASVPFRNLVSELTPEQVVQWCLDAGFTPQPLYPKSMPKSDTTTGNAAKDPSTILTTARDQYTRITHILQKGLFDEDQLKIIKYYMRQMNAVSEDETLYEFVTILCSIFVKRLVRQAMKRKEPDDHVLMFKDLVSTIESIPECDFLLN